MPLRRCLTGPPPAIAAAFPQEREPGLLPHSQKGYANVAASYRDAREGGRVMKRQTLSGVFIIDVRGIALAAPASAAAPPRSDGLVQTDSRTLDEIYVRPGTHLQRYRNVNVDP